MAAMGRHQLQRLFDLSDRLTAAMVSLRDSVVVFVLKPMKHTILFQESG